MSKGEHRNQAATVNDVDSPAGEVHRMLRVLFAVLGFKILDVITSVIIQRRTPKYEDSSTGPTCTYVRVSSHHVVMAYIILAR